MARPKKVVEEFDVEIEEIIDEEEVKKKPKKEKVLTPEQDEVRYQKEAVERRRPWGFRYEVSIAKKEEPNCYVGFYDCDTYKEAEQVCIDKAHCEDRECTVWDYDAPKPDKTVFRCKPPAIESVVSSKSPVDSSEQSSTTSKQRAQSVRSVKRK